MKAMNNKQRVGRFTSSKIFKLMKEGRTKGSFGAPALTYIEEKRFEKKLGRRLEIEKGSRATAWGLGVEGWAFEKLPLSYELLSKTTIVHPDIEFWAGSTDLVTDDAVGNIKCPELKAFCQLIECNGDPELLREYKDGEYFWQLISDATLNNKKYAELIVYVPYFHDLVKIQEYLYDNEEYRWLANLNANELPWIPTGGNYKDLNIFRFEADPYKEELIARVLEAGKLL